MQGPTVIVLLPISSSHVNCKIFISYFLLLVDDAPNSKMALLH